MQRSKIKKLLHSETAIDNVLVKGWVRTKRDSKEFSFLEINDGSCLSNIQAIIDAHVPTYDLVKDVTTGSAVSISGDLIESPGKGQKWEIRIKEMTVIGQSDDTFPLQKKRHSDEYLRTIAHLRPRTNKYGAAFRIRSQLAFAVHKYFNEKGFFYINTPILTGSDCEGAGSLFQVTTIEPDLLTAKKGKDDCESSDIYKNDFFGKKTHLTVSGQLSAEMMALSLGDVYTFGPTFRAENSHTSRHAAEFWMIEPEMAFCDLDGNMDLGEELIKYLTDYILTHSHEDVTLFGKFVDKNLMNDLKKIVSSKFKSLPYKEAVDILVQSGQKFEFEVKYGNDLQSEHERYLTERHFKKPVILYDYPKTIKPFYMRLNDDDETVGAMDVLVPRIGEIIGGSQREERYDVLEKRLKEMDLDPKDYWWYLESRRYGSVPHSGFGMGFERLVMMMTGISNIRDVIPFPRTPGSIDF